MILRRFFLVFVFFFSLAILLSVPVPNFAAPAEQGLDSDQQISDFSLAGYGEKGKKTWDLAGRSADIFDNVVKLKDLTGNLYGTNENVKLSAEKGDFDKATGKIHVEKNVVITTSSGARLTTDSLDWDRVNSVVSTKAIVNLKKENLFTRARGAYGEMGLNKMNLEKEVTVEILPQADPAKPVDSTQERIVITCDGPLQIDYAKNVAIFNNNVKVDREDSQIYSDVMEVYFSSKKDKTQDAVKDPAANSMFSGTSIDKIHAKGNVKTVRGDNITYSEEAVYNGQDQRLVLSGRSRLLIYSTGDFKGMLKQ